MADALPGDMQVRIKAMEISGHIYALQSQAQIRNGLAVTGNPFTWTRRIESYIRNDVITEPIMPEE